MHERAKRRLMAILAADVVADSRLMSLDEDGTRASLTAHRFELVDPAIAKRGGRIVKTTGDGLLVEFTSVVDALECAVEIQRRMARRTADVTATQDLLRLRPGFTISENSRRALTTYRDPAWVEHIADGLRKAGVPE